jgi:predicted nucleic acid-binding protein
MDRVYLETSLISYLAAWPSRDLIVAAHQEITHRWWRTRRSRFELYTSRIVIEEAGAGDKDAAQRRLAYLKSLPVLELNREAKDLAEAFVSKGVLPQTSVEDALHVAVATVHGIDFLLTWNCRHIANAEMTKPVTAICHSRGYDAPHICTPEELMGEEGTMGD